MKKLISLILCASLLLGGCAVLEKANEPVNDLEQQYTKAIKEYKSIKPQLDRDFKMLFGTDEQGHIDTAAIKLQNYPDSGTPGLQDIIATQYRFYPKDKKELLKKANERAIQIYEQYKVISKEFETRGVKAGEALKKLNKLTSQKEVSEEGLTLLTEFIRIAGTAYIKSQRK